jgi:hypothetical protein
VDGHINHLHCRYRVISAASSAAKVTTQLKRVAREQLAQAYERALDQALGDDPAVYILRQLNAGLVISLDAVSSDQHVAQRWGDRLAGSVMRAIARAPEGDDNLVKFQDQADYVARFVADLLASQAWNRWFYGAFRYLQHASLTDALYRVLLDNQVYLPKILAYLHQRRILLQLLKTLDTAAMQALWSGGIRQEDAVQVLLSSGIRQEDAMQALLSSGIMQAEPAVSPTGRQPEAALEVLRNLVQQGYLAWPTQGVDTAFLTRLEQVLAEFPQLDSQWLCSTLATLLAKPPAAPLPGVLSPPAPSATAGYPPFLAEPTAERPALSTTGISSAETKPAEEESPDSTLPPSRSAQIQPESRLVTPSPEPPLPGSDKDRSLFIQTLRLVEQLALWSQPPPEPEILFAAYQPRVLVDWRDPQALTQAVVEILDYLAAQGLLQPPAVRRSLDFLQRLDQVLAGFDWLDRARLRTALLELEGTIQPESRLAVPFLEPLLPGSDKDRSLFIQTLRLVEQLALWVPPPPEPEALFTAYQPRVLVDWRDPQALTQAVVEILDYLATQGLLQPLAMRRSPDFLQRLERVLAGFDWLDSARLRTALREPRGTETGLPTRPPAGAATPRQRELLADLARVLADGTLPAPPQGAPPTAQALNLYAILLAQFPRWQGDNLAARLVEAAVFARQTLLALPSPAHTLNLLRRGELAGALSTLPATPSDNGSVRLFAALGEAGVQFLETLAATGHSMAPATQPIETRCAGVFLLLRAVLDVRLPLLAEGMTYPPKDRLSSLGALLATLGLRWAGAEAVSAGKLDAGLALLAGAPLTLAELQGIWNAVPPAGHDRFQAALLRVLIGQRVVAPATLHLYRLTLDADGNALVVGDASGRVWPLGRVFETEAAIPAILADWLTTWTQTAGSDPVQIVADATLEPWLPPLAEATELLLAEENSITDAEALGAHQQGREALQTALQALTPTALGIPQADLSLALTALLLLRVWARWLRGFATASAPYLLDNLIRRAGTRTVDANSLLVELAPAPLDVVLEIAGYTAELDKLPWLGQRRVKFRIRR